METINDGLKFLNKLKVDVFTTMEGNEGLIRVKEILSILFQDDNSEKLQRILENVREVEVLYLAGDWREISDVVRILRKDNKFLQIEMNDRLYSLTIS